MDIKHNGVNTVSNSRKHSLLRTGTVFQKERSYVYCSQNPCQIFINSYCQNQKSRLGGSVIQDSTRSVLKPHILRISG